jgi:hypothetical protein
MGGDVTGNAIRLSVGGCDERVGVCVQIFALKSRDTDITDDEIRVGRQVLLIVVLRDRTTRLPECHYIRRYTSIQLVQKCPYSRHPCI